MPQTSRHRRSLAAFLEDEVLVLAMVAAFTIGVAATLPAMLVQDGWLALVSGREVAQHGLPAHDQLTVWMHGAQWVDQQWLGQLAFYAFWAVGGWRLLMLALLALLVGTLVVALVSARRRGASPLAVCLVAASCMFMAPWALQLRTQAVAGLLFVALLWLLAEDSRAPSRRVLLALPILVLWANIHGTVVIGAGLVALRAVLLAVDGRRRSRPRSDWALRAALLLVTAPVCTLASPYGLELVGYYRRMLTSPLLREFILEWRPSAPSAATVVFYVVAFASVWLLARQRRQLTAFESLTLLLMLVAGMSAIRSIVWFSLTTLVLLPPMVTYELSAWRSMAGSRVRRLLSGVAVAAIAVAFAATLARPQSWFMREWPAAAAEATAAAVAQDPSARIFANDRYADWLLWEQPELRGRIAYDVRFELFSRLQFEQLVDYRNQLGPSWRRAVRGYGVFVLDPSLEHKVEQRELARAGSRVVYRNPRIAVISAPASPTGTLPADPSRIAAPPTR